METLLLVLVSIGFGALLYRFYCLSFLVALIRWQKKLKVSYHNTKKKLVKLFTTKPRFLKNEQTYTFRVKDRFLKVDLTAGKIKVITIADKIQDALAPHWTVLDSWDQAICVKDFEILKLADFETLKKLR